MGGYAVSQIGREFFIPAGRKQEALEAVRSAGETCGFTAEDIEKAEAKTLEELLDVLEWRPVVDEAGNITDLIFDGEKSYNDDKLMEALAPCVRTGSFIRMVGEDGWVWEWRFDNGGCTQIDLNPDVRWQEASDTKSDQNSVRAERARRALATCYDDDLSTDIIDLLTDLMHLCGQKNLAFSHHLRIAGNHYSEETDERKGGNDD